MLSCKFHPRRHRKLLFLSFKQGCACGETPMYAVCPDCVITLASLTLECPKCRVAASDLYVYDINDDIIFRPEETSNA
jgi:hypothetical protein